MSPLARALRRRLLQQAIVCSGIPLHATARAATVVEQTIALAPWQRLSVQLPATVHVEIGAPVDARIRAEAAVIDRIRFTVRNDELLITPSGSFSSQAPIEIRLRNGRLDALKAGTAATVAVGRLTAQRLQVSVHDSATVELPALELAALRIEADGSASVQAGGKVTDLQLAFGDAASYDARQLESSSVRVSASGSSDLRLGRMARLEATVADAATARYRGKPALKQSVSDAGTLEPDR